MHTTLTEISEKGYFHNAVERVANLKLNDRADSREMVVENVTQVGKAFIMKFRAPQNGCDTHNYASAE